VVGERQGGGAGQDDFFRDGTALGVKGVAFVEGNLPERITIGNPHPESGLLITDCEGISPGSEPRPGLRKPEIGVKG
jgi:hypothetical protein